MPQLAAIVIEARAPLAFARSKPGTQFRESLPYVPGGTIFGALANLLHDADTDKAAVSALLRGLRCHNAYLARAADAWARPFPLTAREPKGGEAVRDMLADLVCAERVRPAFLVSTDDSKPAVGSYTIYGDGARLLLGKRKVTQRVLTRVAINRRSRTAEYQRLYSPLVINEFTRYEDAVEPTRFLGSVVLPDGVAGLAEQLAAITHLGGRQSSGLGGVAVRVGVARPDDATAIMARVERLTAHVRERAAQWQPFAGQAWAIPDRSLFSVGLLADTILLADGWKPTSLLSPELVREATGIDAELVRAVTATTVVSGWSVLWRRPRPSALATALGSVYLFQAAAALTDAQCAALAELQLRGIGERRQEGYGQVRICDEIHYEAFAKEE